MHRIKQVCVQLLSHEQLIETPWTASCQATLSFAISWSLLKFMPIGLVMLSNHLILCHFLQGYKLNLIIIVPWRWNGERLLFFL